MSFNLVFKFYYFVCPAYALFIAHGIVMFITKISSEKCKIILNQLNIISMTTQYYFDHKEILFLSYVLLTFACIKMYVAGLTIVNN